MPNGQFRIDIVDVRGLSKRPKQLQREVTGLHRALILLTRLWVVDQGESRSEQHKNNHR